MRYIGTHRPARTSSSTTGLRAMGVAVAGGATIAAGLATAPTASAAGGVWDRVAACESGGNWSIATGNGYYGGLQFSASSWRAAGGTRYASLPHRASKGQQIAAAQQLLRQQGPGAWPVCSKKAGLTRANGLGSAGGNITASRSTARKSTSNASTAMSRGSVKELQRKVGARVDGIVGPETVRKTERALGLQLTGKRSFSASTLVKAKRFI
ncbi:transglycosylase family protein [Agilicoccus flavus]|uniref:transglycosylase family protein n=1 Tax=Agilicoccus flavus TaxID=2775968 RepID=UPI0027DA0D85|nr:transglycosylase family protein [Agilicoccus flavus]